MKKKIENPLYVVKGDSVEEATGVLDMLVKKFNLEPVFDFFMQVIKMILENVKSYAAIAMINELMEEFMARLELFKKFNIV